ncbi:hypothetical protein NMG46_29270 [Mesorhizobium sp. LMG 17147]|uniref:hypothetical protein n=1 Tax=Mesorhizobium sp. LMG 17147 TaxID=2963091 RepID=UPI0020C9A0FD|nr:hypothetical protein [Mesorhizobium sp. LMG 17147]MCP9234236.1 hypothetical protein [Mesorhizobium sp. LMG 17147]
MLASEWSGEPGRFDKNRQPRLRSTLRCGGEGVSVSASDGPPLVKLCPTTSETKVALLDQYSFSAPAGKIEANLISTSEMMNWKIPGGISVYHFDFSSNKWTKITRGVFDDPGGDGLVAFGVTDTVVFT